MSRRAAIILLCAAAAARAAGAPVPPGGPGQGGQDGQYSQGGQNGQGDQNGQQNTANPGVSFYGAFGAYPPPPVLYAPQYPKTTPKPAAEDASGIYRSFRYQTHPAMLGDGRPLADQAGAEPAEPAATPAPTVDDARASLPTLIQNYIQENAKDGYLSLGGASGRLDTIEEDSVRSLGSGRFAINLLLRDKKNRPVLAEATADLSTNEWRVDGISRRKASDAGRSARCYTAAVKNRVRAGSGADQAFVFHDAEEDRDWRLTLSNVRQESLTAYGGSSRYACVEFRERDSGRSLDLDFYVEEKDGRCSVSQIVLHRIDGKSRVTRPKPLASH